MLQALIILLIILAPHAAFSKKPTAPVLLFDESHKQHFLIEQNKALDLSNLAAIFKNQGFIVKSSARPLTTELLRGISTLIISGPFQPCSRMEIAAIKNFINKGGQLVVMLHIASPTAGLLTALGVAISSNIVHERTNLLSPPGNTNFYVTNLAPHPLTRGLSRINLYGAWALNTRLAANVIARTSPRAWVDLNHDQKLDAGDAVQAFSEIVTGQLGHGHFIIFADDAIFQNRFLTGDNHTLALNMAKWLKQGSYYHLDLTN